MSDLKTVILSHQLDASAFALLNVPISYLFDERVFYLGSVVDIVPYEMSGSL